MNTRFVLILSFLVFCSPPTLAIQPLSLEVVCELAEHRYRLNLSAHEIHSIETDCANEIAQHLGQKFGFLQFVAGETRDNRLEIRLGKNSDEADPSAFRSVNFEIRVSGRNVIEPGEPVIWDFRSADEYFDVPSSDTFANEISIRFREKLDIGDDLLVSEQLSRLQIAASAYPMPTDESWLLPFKRGELGLADDSKFKIRAALIYPGSQEHFTYQVILFGDFASANSVPEEFHNKVKALHLGDDKLTRSVSLQRLLSANDVKVEYVMISHYVPFSRPLSSRPGDLFETE